METYRRAGAALQELATRAWNPTIEPLGSEETEHVVAIDGSNGVLLDRGAVWVVATTAHAWQPNEPSLVEPTIWVASREEASEIVEAQYASLGTPAPRVNNADAFSVALREAAELRLAMDVMKKQPDLLLVDGALVDVPPHAQPICDQLLAAGALGVSKRSGQLADGVPLQFAAARAGKSTAAPWQIHRSHQSIWAKLHAGAKHVYRVDGERPERLVPWCRDAMYLGYPYPLAAAHNSVALTADKLQESRLRLEQAAMQAGVDAWELLADPHAMLDRNT